MRCGIGYDIHVFSRNRTLILGGVRIPYKKGLLGHSDADVLVHSIADALLGACGQRDIGYHFPDTDPTIKGMNSLHVLGEVYHKIVKPFGFFIVNVDSTLVLQEPYIFPYVPQMKKNIAGVLEMEMGDLAVKATKPEGLGSLGKKKGIACLAVVSVDKK